MKYNKIFYSTLLLSAIGITVVNCGGNGGSLGGEKNSKQVGILLDSVIYGAKYKSKSYNGTTDKEGHFDFKKNEKVSFYVGNLELGSVEHVKSDKLVVLQDILRIDRKNVNNEKLIDMAVFLQSIDKDKNPNIIDVRELSKRFSEVSGSIKDKDVYELLRSADIPTISKSDAKEHVMKNLTDNTISYDDINPTVKAEFTDNVDVKSGFKFKFSESIKATSFSSDTLSFKSSNGYISFAYEYDDASKTLSIFPKNTLQIGSTYEINLKKGIVDLYDNPLEPQIFTFSTNGTNVTDDDGATDPVVTPTNPTIKPKEPTVTPTVPVVEPLKVTFYPQGEVLVNGEFRVKFSKDVELEFAKKIVHLMDKNGNLVPVILEKESGLSSELLK